MMQFFDSHPFLAVLFFLFVFRWFARWFLGLDRLRRSQEQYTKMLREHGSLIERQTELIKKHEGVMSRLGEKYL